MSFQAVTWAIAQRAGSPSAKAVLWSIANYANDQWCAWPKQDTIGRDSEQSTDSVGKRIADIVELGLVRRIKLKRFGRRTHDFVILKPSPLFEAPLEVILPHLPSGCDVLHDVAADSGSVSEAESVSSQSDSHADATADSGSVENNTLPQSAVDAPALLRQQEPITNPESLPQTPSREIGETEGQSNEEAAEVSGFEDWFKNFKEIYPIPDSHPERTREVALAFTPEQRAQCLHGASGAAEFKRKSPRASIVGQLRFVRSSALWGEYSRHAPAPRKAPPPRFFETVGSDEWRARAVLYAIVGYDMPVAAFDQKRNAIGAEFLGRLPPSGLTLAKFADAQGRVESSGWPLLYAEPGWKGEHAASAETAKPKIRAWRERVMECLGIELEVGSVTFPGTHEVEALGKIYQMPNRIQALRVPCEWPPAKGTKSQDVAA